MADENLNGDGGAIPCVVSIPNRTVKESVGRSGRAA
jgi:hypothetical protein